MAEEAFTVAEESWELAACVSAAGDAFEDVAFGLLAPCYRSG